MAFGAIERNQGYDFYVPLLDARRMEVYSATYTNKLEEVSETKALIIEEGCSFFPANALFFGDGAEKCEPLLEGTFLTNVSQKQRICALSLIKGYKHKHSKIQRTLSPST